MSKVNKNAAAEVPIELFKLALEAAADGVVITHANGDIIWVNPAYEKLTMYLLEDVQGKPPNILKHGKQDTLFYKQLWGTITAGQVWHGQLWNRRKDGSIYLEEQSITPVKNNAAKVTHYIAIKRDITNQYKLQNQLNMAQRMEAIGKLTAGVAHNFNNKLASILGYAELSVEEAEQYSNAELTDYLQEISVAGKLARDIVRQMMTFSRNDVNEMQSIDLLDVIKESFKILSSTLPAAIKLITHLEDVPGVKADPVRLHQMILSLVFNASEAMNGKGVITIGVKKQNVINKICSSCHENVNGEYVVLYVQDTGKGIDKKNMENIFLPFFTTREQEGGTGMGLSALHGMLHDQQGHVFVDSVVGKYTEFSIFLPQVELESGEDEDDNNQYEAGKNIQHKIRIMIVDDEEPVANVLAEILNHYEYEATVETNSKTALKNFSDNPDKYDLIITDKDMPDFNGIEFAGLIKEIKSDMPVILMTGYDDNNKEVIGGNIKLVLNKPFETSELIENISKLMSTK